MRPAGSQHVEMQIGDGPRRQIACDNWQSLVEALRTRTFPECTLHYVHGLPAGALTLDLHLVCHSDVTLRYFTVCPQCQLVNAKGVTAVTRPVAATLSARPHAWNMSITEWREAFASYCSALNGCLHGCECGGRRAAHLPALERAEILAHPGAAALPTVVEGGAAKLLSPAKGLNVATDVAAYAGNATPTGDPLDRTCCGSRCRKLLRRSPTLAMHSAS